MKGLSAIFSRCFLLLAFGLFNSNTLAQQQILIRPKTDTLPEQLVANIVNNIDSKQLPIDEVKRYVGKSYSDFIKTNCGSIQPGYTDFFLKANNLAPLDIEKKITENVDHLILPACIYIEHGLDDSPILYTVREGDNLSKLHERFTGAGYDPSAISSYFSRKKETLNIIKYGQKLELPFVSVPSMIPAQNVSTTFLKKAGEFEDSIEVIPPEKQISYGEVITPVNVRGQTSSETVDCAGGGENYPFDANLLKSIYDFSLKASSEPPSKVNVAVVDNGFQGVTLAKSGEVLFGSNGQPLLKAPFPKRIFFTTGTFKFLGPEIRGVSPINYLNVDSPYSENEINGHGTHVTGLIFGGYSFYEQFKALYSPNFSYIKTDIINIGNSKQILPQYSERLLREGLRQLPEWRIPHIVNISLSYDLLKVDRRPDYVKEDLLDALTLTGFERSLFVVAAGNNGIDLSSTNRKLYPAMFGGTVLDNVITVTSHDTDGALSSFANTGENHVDIAAPGCEIPSWIKSTLTPTYLSGTSQSAPIVSFIVALYKTIKGATATEIKNRLMYSGDLIKDKVERKLVRSKAMLNPYKMLLPHFDFLHVVIDGESKILLGEMSRASGFYCEGDQYETPWQGINAYKKGAQEAYLYIGDKNDNDLRICDGNLRALTSAGNENVVAFKARYELSDTEIITLPNDQTQKTFYKAGQIIEIVRSELQ